MRTTSSLVAAVLAASLAPACTTQDVEDELAGEGDDGEAGKDDSIGAFTYFQISPEPRADTDPGFIVSRPNRTTTACGGNATAANCFVRSIDWSGTGLADELARSLEERLRAGEPILLRGNTGAETSDVRNRRLGASASARLRGEFSSVLAGAQPMISVGANPGPDCLYANLTVTKVNVTSASVSATATTATGAVHVTAGFDDVSITASTSFAVSCVNGTGPISIRIGHVDVSGELVLGAAAEPQLAVESATLTGLVVDGLAQLPGPVADMLSVHERAGDLVARTASVLLAPLAAGETGEQLQLAATETWIPSGDAADLGDDVLVFAQTSGTRILEKRINSTRTSRIDKIDFAASGAATDEMAAGRDALSTDGVLLVGPRFTSSGKTGRRAERFWLRAGAAE